MHTNMITHARRLLLTLALAAVLAVTASYAPVLLDETAGTNLTSAAYACPHTGGGC